MKRPDSIPILYEDDAVIALDKPAGLAAVPVKGAGVVSALALLRGRHRAFIVHRIDRFTSGILLFAKTGRDREALVRQFLDHTPVREYLAVVRGRPDPPQGTLVHYFKREGMVQKLRGEEDSQATRAELRYRIERPLRGAALVRVRLVTGLQNQIRAQFSAIGHPVVGDRKYRPEEASETRISRVALHAAHLEFLHPRTGRRVSIDCGPPPDFAALLRRI